MTILKALEDMEEEDETPTFIDTSDNRSDGTSLQEGQRRNRSSIGSFTWFRKRALRSSRQRRVQGQRSLPRLLHPNILGAAGCILALISIGLIIAGALIPQKTISNDSDELLDGEKLADRDSNGVPLDSVEMPDPAEVSECQTRNGDWDTYQKNAVLAERKVYGQEVETMSRERVESILLDLKRHILKIPVYYWVLASPSHPWSTSFIDAAQEQTDILTGGFSSAGLVFELREVFIVPSTNEQMKNCAMDEDYGDKDMEYFGDIHVLKHALSQEDMKTAVHIVVCEPVGLNGATNILGSSLSFSGKNQGLESENSDLNIDQNGKNVYSSSSISLKDVAIILRRSSLWHVKTALIHQMGHFIGLPHPYPDHQSCKYDADVIQDTPLQYQQSKSCDEEDEMPLCHPELNETLDASQLLFRNFMDAAGDGCRRFFTAGQVLRARAMLQVLRPSLHRNNGQNAFGQHVLLGAKGAFQSSLPSIKVLGEQLHRSALYEDSWKLIESSVEKFSNSINEDVFENDFNFGDLPQSSSTNMQKLLSAFAHARLPLDTSKPAISIEHSACVGKDAYNESWWTVELDNSYICHAVEIVQPWESIKATTLRGIFRYDFATHATFTDLVGFSPEAEGSSPESPSEEISVDGNVSAVPALIDIRVGNSPYWLDNKPCTSKPVSLTNLVHITVCDSAVEGRFLTVRWIDSESNQALGPRCLAKVSVWSQFDPPIFSRDISVSKLPGTLLKVDQGRTSFYASSLDILLNEKHSGRQPDVMSDARSSNVKKPMTTNALPNWQPEVHEILSIDSLMSGVENLAHVHFFQEDKRRCISTMAEESPSWSIDFGSSNMYIRGIRVALPHYCLGGSNEDFALGFSMESISMTCDDILYTFDVYASTEPLAKFSEELNSDYGNLIPSSENGELVHVIPATFYESYTEVRTMPNNIKWDDIPTKFVCARKVDVPAGRIFDIDCGSFIPARYLTIVSRRELASKLNICGIQLLGGLQLSAENLIRKEQLTKPLDLLNMYTFAVDDNELTCLTVSKSNHAPDMLVENITLGSGSESIVPKDALTMWRMGFETEYLIIGMDIHGMGFQNQTEILGIEFFRGGLYPMHSGSISITSTDVQPSKLDYENELLNSDPYLNSKDSIYYWDEETNMSTISLIDPPILASALQLTDFQSLCEVKTIVGQALPDNAVNVGSNDYQKDAGYCMVQIPAKSAGFWGNIAGIRAGALIQNAGAVVDGNLSTCIPFPEEMFTYSSSNDHDGSILMTLMIDLSSHISSVWGIKSESASAHQTIRILTNATVENVTVALGSPGISDISEAKLCGDGKLLKISAWTVLNVNCANVNEGNVIHIYFHSNLGLNINNAETNASISKISSPPAICEVFL